MFNRYSFLNYLASCLLFTTMSESFASSFTLSGSSDSADSESHYIDVSIDINKQHNFYIGSGESTIKDTSGEIKTTNYNFGFSGLASDQFDYDIGYTFWGNKNEISNEALHFALSIYTDNWKFTIRPEVQDIILYTINTRQEIDIDASGIYNSVQYYGIENLELLYSHSSYNYSRNPGGLNTRLAILFFSNTTLLLSGNFIETKDLAEISFIPASIAWLPERISLSFSQTVNAVDKSETDTASLKISVNFSKNFSADFEAGEINPQNSENLSFFSTSLSVSF